MFEGPSNETLVCQVLRYEFLHDVPDTMFHPCCINTEAPYSVSEAPNDRPCESNYCDVLLTVLCSIVLSASQSYQHEVCNLIYISVLEKQNGKSDENGN